MEENRIGIPPQLMKGQKGERIPFEHWGEGLIVLNKPCTLASKADPWFAKKPDLESAFNAQIPSGKPELQHHGITDMRVCNPLESETTGAVLTSVTQESIEHWRNAYGSFQFQFHTLLVTRKTDKVNPIKCDLPLMRHFKNERMMVSHNLGKKAYTQFTLLCSGRDADAWLASSRYPRLHQFRVHARESGIPLLRDPLYDPDYPEDLLKKNPYKLDWAHCYCIDAAKELDLLKPRVKAAPPKYWKRNLRKTGLEIDEILGKSDEIIENITLPIE